MLTPIRKWLESINFQSHSNYILLRFKVLQIFYIEEFVNLNVNEFNEKVIQKHNWLNIIQELALICEFILTKESIKRKINK